MSTSSPTFEPRDPNFAQRVRSSFERQKIMQTIGAALTDVQPGLVEIELPFQESLTQQHGYLHAGAVATIADSACGYAALSLSSADMAVLTVEYKINLLAPAQGERLLARGYVIRPGRTITACTGEVFAFDGDEQKLVASMLSTIMVFPKRQELVD